MKFLRRYFSFRPRVYRIEVSNHDADGCVLYNLFRGEIDRRKKENDWRDTEHSELDDFSQSYLPHMDKDNGKLMSLNIEAVK